MNNHLVENPIQHPSMKISWLGTVTTPINTEGALAISRVIFSYGAYPLYISTDESKGVFVHLVKNWRTFWIVNDGS